MLVATMYLLLLLLLMMVALLLGMVAMMVVLIPMRWRLLLVVNSTLGFVGMNQRFPGLERSRRWVTRWQIARVTRRW